MINDLAMECLAAFTVMSGYGLRDTCNCYSQQSKSVSIL